MYQIIKAKKVIIPVLVLAVFLLSAVISVVTIRSVPTAAESESICLPVIMYHGFSENAERRNKYFISPDCLEQDLAYLTKNGYHTIFVSELISYFTDGTALPDKPVLLTFDDGYYDNYVYAFPLLKKYGCKAVISPIVKPADEAETEEYRSVLWSQCRWEELNEMCQSGLVELQNHTYDLHHIDGSRQGLQAGKGESDEDYRTRLTEDLTKANNRITEKTGTTPTAVVYPFGAVSHATESIVRQLGFRAAFDCEEKVNYLHTADDLFSLHRFLRPDNISAEVFFKRLTAPG